MLHLMSVTNNGFGLNNYLKMSRMFPEIVPKLKSGIISDRIRWSLKNNKRETITVSVHRPYQLLLVSLVLIFFCVINITIFKKYS